MGTLSYLNEKFYFNPKSNAERQLALDNGLKLDTETLRWVTRSAGKARALRRYADGSAELKLKNTFITDLAAPESIIYPDHLTPTRCQIESVWHCTTRTPAYCADEAGLGKTAMSIMCMNTVPGKVLITCPAFLKYNWFDELNIWMAKRPTTRFIIEGTNPDPTDFDANIIICPDSVLAHHRIQERLRAYKFTWLFGDEWHRFNHSSSARTQAMMGKEDHDSNESENITGLAERTVFLSGTPMPNGKPIELYPTLSKLAPEAMGHRTLEEYGKKFCAGKRITRYEGRRAITAWDFSGASQLKKLRRELREKFMIRHLKKDCLKDLPPKTRRLIFLDQPKRFIKYDAEMLKAHTLEELMGEGTGLGDISQYRREVGEAKILPAFNYIKTILESNARGKIVLFAHHITVVDSLYSYLSDYHPLKIRGGMSAKQKQKAVEFFQNELKHRIIIGNLDAMGVGNTLTKAPRAIMVEWSFVPGVNEQAEDRIHRMSQESNVLIDYLVHRNSLDERMLRASMKKAEHISSVMN